MADLLDKLHAAKKSSISNPAALRNPSMTNLHQRASCVAALYERLLDGDMSEAAKYAHVREILLQEGVAEADVDAVSWAPMQHVTIGAHRGCLMFALGSNFRKGVEWIRY